jgi:endonuclease/exonuclease/phosphatase family metal-dependent hydrolase
MEKRHLKVLSYNIHKGFTSGNRSFVLSRIREAIRTVQPDVVCLQEVMGAHEDWKRKIDDWPTQSQFEYLADQMWPHYAYGKNAIYTSGHHGNAILSKYPFTDFENIDISTNRVEKRGLLHGVVNLPGKKRPLHVICVHLGLLEAERRSQVQRICDRIESHVPHDEPLLICGDFNDWLVRASKTLERTLEVREIFLALHGAHAGTYPSWLPALRLDRIYYRGMKAEKAQTLAGKPWSELSDHLALYAELGV